METTPSTQTVQHVPDTDSVDASIAAARRVQHLGAIVRDRLTDTDSLTGDDLAKAVVKTLYDVHPHIRLDDALELATLVETPPEELSTRRAIEHVVDDACTLLEEWGGFTPPRTVAPETETDIQAGPGVDDDHVEGDVDVSTDADSESYA